MKVRCEGGWLATKSLWRFFFISAVFCVVVSLVRLCSLSPAVQSVGRSFACGAREQLSFCVCSFM